MGEKRVDGHRRACKPRTALPRVKVDGSKVFRGWKDRQFGVTLHDRAPDVASVSIVLRKVRDNIAQEMVEAVV